MGNAGGKSKPLLNKKKTKHGKTRRGYSKHQSKRKHLNLKFSIMGCNANGLSGKLDSLENAISHFDRPSCITIQESKLRTNVIKIPGYQTFLRNRKGYGGGLLTAIESNLSPIMVSLPEKEILVVQVTIGHLKVRIINAYGPQEDDMTNNIYEFWQELEKEIIDAKNQDCCVLLQCDANAKLGKTVIRDDPNDMSGNGQILSDILNRNNLYVLNSDILCTGTITRHRMTKKSLETSILDYIIVCDILKAYFEEMIIDEDRTHVLTKYASTKGCHKNVQSDHNILYSRFAISYRKTKPKTVREIFNLKNEANQAKFFEATCKQIHWLF